MKKTIGIVFLAVASAYVGAGLAWEAAKFSQATVDTVQFQVIFAGLGIGIFVDWLRRLFS